MKHISVIVTAIIVIVALGLVTGKEYQAYQGREHARVNAANARVVAEQKQATEDQTALQKRTTDLYAQCKAGEAAYALLPAATRSLKTTVVPVCGLPIVE